MQARDLLFEGIETDYETIGHIRFRRYQDLLTGECKAITQLEREEQQSHLQIMLLAERIGKAQGITSEEAMERIANAGKLSTGEQLALMADHAEEVLMLVSSAPDKDSRDRTLVTAFFSRRAEVQTEDGWQPLEGWTSADTDRLPRGMFEKVRAFVHAEMRGPTPAGGAEGKPPARPPKRGIKD